MRQNEKKQIDKKLTKKEFTSALKKGLGRAFLHVSQYGLENIADLVLEACLHDQNYDTQCESSRASWLFEMIKDKAEYPAFRSSILKALESETNGADLSQLCYFAKEMAQNGDKDAKRILRKSVLKFAKTTELDGLGADDFVELYGNSAVLDLAKIYGKRYLKEPEEYISYGFYCDDNYLKLLNENSKFSPEIKAFRDYLFKSGNFRFQKHKNMTGKQIRANQRKRRNEFRKKYPLKKIIEDARNGVGLYPGHYVDFGYYAAIKELEIIYELLLTETDEEVLMRLLWIFRRTSLPVYSPKYFKWANGEHEGLRSASIAALAQVPDKKVHELARAKAKSGKILGTDREALDLFIENYTGRDAGIIINTLNSVKPTPVDAHKFSHSIRNLTDKYKDSQLADALIWVYENTPCTICRGKMIEKLHEFGKLNDSILHECLYDANEEIREFAHKTNNKAGKE